MIPVRNIYYMLAYSFRDLQRSGYEELAAEDFENSAELCAAILAKGIESQVKRGLGREYVEEAEALSTLRGKIDVSESLKTQTFSKRQAVCSYDVFSTDSVMNRILKATMLLLLSSDIAPKRKKPLRKLLPYFSEVAQIDVRSIDWNVRLNRNNETYRMLLFVCYLVVGGLLQAGKRGASRLTGYIDDRPMCQLYEKFILAYYRKEHPELHAGAPRISWKLDDGMGDMLPRMQTDIVLERQDKMLIIDAKYYTRTMQQRYGVRKIHSQNLYQIFAYVKNKQFEQTEEPCAVSGLLLYAQTDEVMVPHNEYAMSGNRIGVQCLDLDCDFSEIRQQLDAIVECYLQ
ncbi:5-methylcytosine-specific restriction endonuclease system specificity protein McrC [Eggerthella sinensis]|uniref:5-methylcytosine-specific restriction endonuclease system specificity protein McrC n=1 Tax=Eggerthella sinensis TaxID=242230 RepID=UPI00248D5656|nr:5-methylcytosine-specific restriction endonuclease system specificity protein McrC [Eggerthella sinensis]